MKIFLVSIFAFALLCQPVFSATIPAGQDAGSTLRTVSQEDRDEKVMKRLNEPRIIPPALTERELESLPGGAETVYVKKIIVTQDRARGVGIKDRYIREFTRTYENKDLSIHDMKNLADELGREFSEYNIDSYVPRQSFYNGIFFINFVRKRESMSGQENI